MRIAAQLKIISLATIAMLVVLTPLLVASLIEFQNAKNDRALTELITSNVFERDSLRDQYFLYREDRVRARWDDNKRVADDLLRQAKIQLKSEEDRQTLAQLSGFIEDTVLIFHRVVANTERIKNTEGGSGVYEEFDKRLHSQLLLKGAGVRKSAIALEYLAIERAEQAYKYVLIALVCFALTLALTTVLTLRHISRVMSRRLIPLHEGADIVSRGNLDYRIASDGADEFADLARSFNGVTEKLSALTQGLEKKVAERTVSLTQSRSQFHNLFMQSPVAMALNSKDGVIEEINRKFVEIFGYTLDDLPTLETWWSLAYPEEAYRAEVSANWLRAAEIAIRDGSNIAPMEVRITCKDGAKRSVVINGTFVGELLLVTFNDITERKKAEEDIRSLVFSDTLTGLPNRRLLMERLKQAMVGALRHKHQDALLFVDMDDFKTLNDSLGHDKGDQLLQQIAGRMLACVREGDTVARLGGDEFVVLLEDLDKRPQEAAKQAEVVGRKIHDALHQPYQLGSHGHHSSASIGITLFGGAQRESIEEPLKRAELAMYKAKAVGRDNLRFFEPEMRNAINARATLEAQLHQALRQAQFLLYYQAQVDRDAHLTGVEALVRWQHPERGLVSPGEFIPVAEANGLILPLGRWVLETACKQLAAWALRPEMAHLTISVNVSARQFRSPNFVEEVLAVLQATAANPKRLKLELTESLLLDNMKDIITKMTALKSRGVRFSLDDFGTGYSSLSYLKRLPLDQLKIDQGFVRDILTDPNDAAIAKMVVALAETMGLGVIAEGVETQAQRDTLAALGCHAYQGYLYGKPLPIDELEAFARGT